MAVRRKLSNVPFCTFGFGNHITVVTAKIYYEIKIKNRNKAQISWGILTF